MQPIAIHWFRRDLRLDDNTALYHALQSGYPVLPVFIFDTDILDDLKDAAPALTPDRRVAFIHQSLQKIKRELNRMGADLLVFYGKPLEVWKTIIEKFPVKKVFTNRDYEPYAIARDRSVGEFLKAKSVAFETHKDQVIFETDEVVKENGSPYTVYTPYSKQWKKLLTEQAYRAFPTETLFQNFWKTAAIAPMPTLEELGFTATPFGEFPPPVISPALIANYAQTRDFPAVEGTSHMSVHLRFGTISIRRLIRETLAIGSEKFLNELIWREFYMAILWHFPRVVSESFRSEYDRIAWRNDEREFEKWRAGQTSYPIVDAGMRELAATGWMHNRVRMIVASFLTKHLLIDWRWGEAWFAKHLLDFELSSNNGGWQWAAGTGVDAAPYFRIFNPYLQTQKFDPELKYIRRWVPELETLHYPPPLVEHEAARRRCLEVYQAALR